MAALVAGRHDHGVRRRAVRKGRERGCSVYIPAELLQVSPVADTWPIFYRVWGGARGRYVVTLYPVP